MAALNKFDIIIIGGGLAGLTCALHLSQSELRVLLIEKDPYPRHKVCGEYVSNEVLPYLNSLGINPSMAGAKSITNLEISTKNGKLISATLPLGGFGISRYTLDNLFYMAIKDRVEVRFETVESIEFMDDDFVVTNQNKTQHQATFVIGAFGKRSNLDKSLQRKFTNQTSPWLAVKAHYEYDFAESTVALHNFEGGYCGLSKTETDAVNACYLTTYKSFKRFGNIESFQKQVISENPFLDEFFSNAKPIFKKPLTISQISFSEKKPVENHIFMIGDSAGLIHPLSGNGMAMAIHSAKIFSETFLKLYRNKNIDRLELESSYESQWYKNFSKRLKTGRRIQRLLLQPRATSLGFSVAKLFPQLVPSLIKKTHGETIL